MSRDRRVRLHRVPFSGRLGGGDSVAVLNDPLKKALEASA